MKQGVLQLNNDAHKKYDTSINRYLTSNSPGPILELIIPRMVSIGLPINGKELFRPAMDSSNPTEDKRGAFGTTTLVSCRHFSHDKVGSNL